MLQRHLILTDDIYNVDIELKSKRAHVMRGESHYWHLKKALSIPIEAQPFHPNQSYEVPEPSYEIADLHIYVRRPVDLLNHRLRGTKFDCIIAHSIDEYKLYAIPKPAMDEIRHAIAEMVNGDERRLIGGFL